MTRTSTSRLIVLTGATRGLGRALTDGLIAAGHTLVGCGRSASDIASLRRDHGQPHRFDQVDVSNADAVTVWAQAVVEEQGVPDLLINNAALINRNAPLWEVPAAEFNLLMDVNVNGIARVLRGFVPAMVSQNHGVIVNLSSGWGRSTSAEMAPYCASKWAVEGLTRALAQELPSGMAAVPLNPGVINTEMLQSCFGASAQHYPTADQWAQRAVRHLLQLSAQDNGQPSTVPQ